MGICASCLGLNRPSQDGDLDRILDSDQPNYGSNDHDVWTQPDEQELSREREELERISARAAEQMIDVQHPSHADLNNSKFGTNINHTGVSNHNCESQTPEPDYDQEAEAAAWLESIQAEGLVQVRLPQQGALATSVSVLREGANSGKADTNR